ncbi:hypothetical protein LSG31_07290 [Fodinisporobacter ferrooxydans]|uniref:Uncharacterized protein n=1 Tax=Fodinisporobacter ferrooxydans TaxID=2901836 RepID=A0ABY4CPY6_9BACL|nr:hypothetical protein LSG31_07290 [Alicyclobacillaceae bacterium MYW30-H2]
MLQFIASMAGILLSSPKAKRALRSLAVKGTVAALEVKDQMNHTIKSMKKDSQLQSEQFSAAGTTSGMHSYEEYAYDGLQSSDNPSNEYSQRMDTAAEVPGETLPDISQTFAVLDDKTIEKYLPKP